MSRAIFSFGRYNPPTVAHDALFKQMCYDSQVFRCSDVYFFVSQTQDKKRNPLSYQFKLDYLRKVYPQLNFIQDETIKTPFDAVCYLGKKGFEYLTFYVGSDRVEDFRIQKYINHPDLEKRIPTVQQLTIVQFGENRKNNNLSSTAAREAAKVGDFYLFSSLVVGSVDQKLELYSRVIEGMKVE